MTETPTQTDPTRTVVNSWRASEVICRDLAGSAAKWTAEFFAPDSATFAVAYSSRDKYETQVDPNATTSSVVLIAKDIEVFPRYLAGLDGVDLLRDRVNKCVKRLGDWELQQLLPLKSFGPLPLFSVAYLAEALSYSVNPLATVAYAICIRRIMFELFKSQQQHWIQNADEIHPYVLFHSTRALSRFRDLLIRAWNKKDKATLDIFAKNFSDDEQIKELLVSQKYEESKAEEVCGASTGAGVFQDQYVATITSSGAGSAIERAFLFIEGLAFSQSIAELAKDSSDQIRAADPSILAFALYTLSILNSRRHLALLGQGVRALANTCDHGHFQPGRPFHIDDKGRALAVLSVEISNALLAVALERVDSADNAEITAVLDATKDVEILLAGDTRQVEITGDSSGSGLRQGWCSDRAPSSYRVDAWVNAYAALFFLQRLRLLAAVKRRHVLTRYSWIPHLQCRPKWEEINDPNEGTRLPSLKQTIEDLVIMPSSGKRSRAPVFLLYGPPGTSKTSFVHGIASRIGWDLVTLSPSDFIADSLDRIELRAREIFEDLGSLDSCVILLDEMDSLLRDREILADKSAGSIMEFVVPALLPKLQQLRDYTLDKHIAVFFVSNYYESIDGAILRSGRIDTHLLVLPYGKTARGQVLESLVERDIPNLGKSERTELITYVEKLPCNLVYRDLESIVQAIATATSASKVRGVLKQITPSLGISPEIYNPKRRPKALVEFCAMLARLVDSSDPLLDSNSTREVAVEFILSKRARLRKGPWRLMADAWVNKLRTDLI
jgi:hypothetical protein